MRKLLASIIVIMLLGCSADKDGGNNNDFGLFGNSASFTTSGRPNHIGGQPLDAGRGNSRFAYTDMGSDAYSGANRHSNEPVIISDNGSTVSIDFVNTEIQEFIRVVFDEVLKENVIVDPNLTGKITVRTSEPVSRTAALSLVRNVLQMNGASLNKSGAVFRVTGRGTTQGRGQIGENIRIVPLKFLKAEQAQSALQPFVGSGTQVSANGGASYIVLSGAPADIDNLTQVLDSLDVDQMKGMSFALVPLSEAGSPAIANELGQMFGQQGQDFKAMPIQRMNAILLISKNASSITRAKDWIRRLDQGSADDRKVHIYPVQNRKAADIAEILNGMLDTDVSQAGSATAPAFTPSQNGNTQTPESGNAAAKDVVQSASFQQSSAFQFNNSLSGSQGASSEKRTQIQIKADTASNALVIIAKQEDYIKISGLIRRLDVSPTQVLIEVTIAEVSLNNALRHGVRWYFSNGNHSLGLNDNGSSIVSNKAGFNYAFTVPQGRLVVNALDRVTNVQIISSPALMVLDNQTATLKIGDQVPVATRSSQSTNNPDAPIVNDIELKDTGIILSVTPRVKSSGLVTLDISQEASDVVQTTSSAINSPTIRQRKINSSVAVQSGVEIILGGLVSVNKEKSEEGIPLLKDIPVLGNAFKSDASNGGRRTELLVIIRPTVVANGMDVQNVTQEIKARMKGLNGAMNSNW